MPKLNPPSKESLEACYALEQTISGVARTFNVSNPTVRKWLRSFDIKTNDQLTASRISNLRRVSSVPSKEDLTNSYNKMSLKELEEHYGVGQSTVYDWLEAHGIPRRTLSESCLLGKEKQFSDIRFSEERIVDAFNLNDNVNEFANSLGISRSYAASILKQNNLKYDPSYRSKEEVFIFEECLRLSPNDHWEHSCRSLIPPYELDIVNHTKKIAIEYCGLYWHSEVSGKKNSRYHKSKYDMCKSAGYELLTIFSSDDKTKVHGLLRKKVSMKDKVFARNCTVKDIDVKTSKEFLEKYHLSGFVGAKHHIGCFYNDDLVMVMTFGKSRYSSKHEFECIRMASCDKYVIVGGASKMFKYFVKTVNPESVQTFADLRFGSGATYEKCGFSKIKDSPPNYWYFHKSDTNKIWSRVKFQKHKLKHILQSYDDAQTEFANMQSNGWDRIWDCGNAVYEWKRK